MTSAAILLRPIHDLRGFSVQATDGMLGQVRDFFFDDMSWAVRFFVVETDLRLNGRRVLVPPVAIGEPDWQEHRLPVSLTRAQVEHSPDVDTHKPVSRQHEIEQFTYYGYPLHTGGPGVWGQGMLSAAWRGAGGIAKEADFVAAQAELHRERGDDPHLRSVDAMLRYHVHAVDGDIGHVNGLIVDVRTWTIRYLVVNTSDWWFGHDVLLASQWIDDISWLKATVSVDSKRQAVKAAPVYDPAVPLDRAQEMRLYQHHGRQGYWEAE